MKIVLFGIACFIVGIWLGGFILAVYYGSRKKGD